MKYPRRGDPWSPADYAQAKFVAARLYGIENFCDMIADETTCGSGDPEELLAFLSEVGHPVLGMEPFDM